MALIKKVKGFSPKIGKDTYLADNASIIGDVEVGSNCSIWFNTVIRGDVNRIIIGDKVNIQDGSVIHCTYKKSQTNIGNNVSIGHNSIIHGANIKDNVLIGMGSIIMDNCIIESNSIIAAGSVLLEGTIVQSYSVYAGLPAKKIKNLDAETLSSYNKKLSENYVMYSSWFKD